MGVCLPALAAAQQPPPAAAQLDLSDANFTVFVRGVPVGSEQATISRSAEGWTITGSGRMGQPIDLVHRRIQVRYSEDWKPLELTVDASLRGQPLLVRTVVNGTVATTEFTQAGKSGQKTEAVAPDALLLPSPFWGPFEALAVRARTAAPGTIVPAYVVQAPMTIQLGEPTTERLQTANRLIDVRRTPLKLMAAAAPIDAELWSDETGRMLRLTIPSQSIDVIREDIASVSTRRVPISRANDEQIRIPANGFTLAGTLSRPADRRQAGRLPAVILVGGSGPTDRDSLVHGIPILGQLAGAIADAGFIVIRYDKRGVGQSGGRAESAGLEDYAADLRAAVEFAEDRDDVDDRRIVVIGHSEGGAVAMLAAAEDRRITAIGLLAASGVTGAELVLQQQAHLLDLAKASEAERAEKIALQRRIHEAVISGAGWEDLPAGVRSQVDNPEFRTILTHDPATILPETRQPVLILQGELDTQVAPANADRLAELARQRKGRAVQVVTIPNVNHLLVAARTGEVDEYPSLPEKRVSAAVVSAITSWLQSVASASGR
jgi:alpha-beta hydrolase superfamily lysophospholipase